jgi:IS605 OrfB family transposase
VVERISDAGARKVDDRLHKSARQIVEDAEERNAIIVVGNLGGIRKDNDKGRYVNDKTHEMLFARLLNYIEYKAHDSGIDVQSIEEYDTSQTCNRCACEGVRATQGRFECPECGLDDNADKNGVLNIGKRASGTFSKPLSEAGAVLAQPETPVVVPRDEEPASLPLIVDSTPSGGTPRLKPWEDVRRRSQENSQVFPFFVHYFCVFLGIGLVRPRFHTGRTGHDTSVGIRVAKHRESSRVSGRPKCLIANRVVISLEEPGPSLFKLVLCRSDITVYIHRHGNIF